MTKQLKKQEKEKDLELAAKARAGCNDSFNKLTEKHGGLFTKMTKKYEAIFLQKGVLLQDVQSDRDFVIWGAILSYKPEKGMKVSSWIGLYTRYHCLNLINKKKVETIHKDLGDFNDVITEDGTENHDVLIENSAETQEDWEVLVNDLEDEDIKNVLTLRYLKPNLFGRKKSWREIKEVLGMSYSKLKRLHNLGISSLKTLTH